MTPRWYASSGSELSVTSVAAGFVPRVRGLFTALGMICERFVVHIEPCLHNAVDADGDVLYYLYISVRAHAPHADAAQLLETLRSSWQRSGWTIERFQRLPGGGISLAAVDPDNGHRHALDCGLKTDSTGIVVGFFTTRSHSAPANSIAFGVLRAG